MRLNKFQNKFIQNLQQALGRDLPGFKGQRRMMPVGRKVIPPETSDYSGLRPAAVLLALFPDNKTWRFPLIQRVADGFAHSGQVALPGGKLETGETPEMAAVREAEEEIGLGRTAVRVIGKLSLLPIPVSRYLVHPIVGVMSKQPDFRLQPGEVESVFTITLGDLRSGQNQATEIMHFRGKPFEVPCFHFKPHKVWGATAMILAEFLVILNSMKT